MKAYFARKTLNLQNLITRTQQAKQEKVCGSAYTVTKEVELSTDIKKQAI